MRIIAPVFAAILIPVATLSAQAQQVIKVPRPPVTGPFDKPAAVWQPKDDVVPAPPPVIRASGLPDARRANAADGAPVAAAVRAIGTTFDDPELVLFDQPRADGPLWARGRNFKASFAADGWTFRARPPAGAADVA